MSVRRPHLWVGAIHPYLVVVVGTDLQHARRPTSTTLTPTTGTPWRSHANISAAPGRRSRCVELDQQRLIQETVQTERRRQEN